MPEANAQFDAGDYTASLQTLAVLRAPVDAFFDDVMVNAEQPDLRLNRQGLLKTLHVAMNRVADLRAWRVEPVAGVLNARAMSDLPAPVAPSAAQRTAWLLFAPPALLAGLRWLLQWQGERGRRPRRCHHPGAGCHAAAVVLPPFLWALGLNAAAGPVDGPGRLAVQARSGCAGRCSGLGGAVAGRQRSAAVAACQPAGSVPLAPVQARCWAAAPACPA